MVTQITPTSHAAVGMWNGTRLEGQQFTEQQKARMILMRGQLDRWEVRTLTMKRPRARTAADIACNRPAEQCFDLVDADCPIIARGMESDTIITPGGDEYRAPVRAKKG